VIAPLELLNQLDATALEWLVPGHRRELITELARGAPKEIRRQLIPFNETIAEVASAIEAAIASGELVIERLTPSEAVADAIARHTGVAPSADQLRSQGLAPHLRMNVIVVDSAGQVVDAGRDVRAIMARQSSAIRQALAGASGIDEGRHATTWEFGDLEPVLETGPADRRRRSYPALVDEGDAVSLRVFSDPDVQQRVMRAGVRRLLILTAAPRATSLVRRLDQRALLAVAGTGFEPGQLADDAIAAAVDRLMATVPPPWTAAGFEELRRSIASRLEALAGDALDAGVGIVAHAAVLRDRLAGLGAAALAESIADVEAHLDRLVRPRFILTAGTHRLPDLARYLRGIEYRLDRLRGAVDRDRARIAEVVGLERRYRQLLTALDDPRLDTTRRPNRATVVDLGWQLEEWRIAVFAQELGAVGKPSAARLHRQLAGLGV
jgi:ATP-dependent helicase HrpA